MTALEKLRAASEYLQNAGIADAHREAELIISECLGIDRLRLYRDDPDLSAEAESKINEFLARRRKREPLQYILGYTEFGGLKIMVGPGLLVPRPETELLVDEAVRSLKSSAPLASESDSSLILHPSSLNILDLCTGSGCIALALGKAFPGAKIYGTDTSEVAIDYAKKNAELNGVENVTFLNGDLFQPLEKLTDQLSPLCFDLIVSNPPYIKRGDIVNLQPEISEWEPVAALDGGGDGLSYYRRIIPGAKGFLRDKGFLILEIGVGQAEDVERIAYGVGFADISFMKDFAGIDRIFEGRI